MNNLFFKNINEHMNVHAIYNMQFKNLCSPENWYHDDSPLIVTLQVVSSEPLSFSDLHV